MNVAALRAIMRHRLNRTDEAWHSLYSDADGLHFAFVSRDNGLLYRSSPAGINGVIEPENDEDIQKAVTEIQRTIAFVTNQFKGVSAGLMVLSGAIAAVHDVVRAVESSIGLRVETVNVYEQCGLDSPLAPGFEPALGLCMYD